MKKTYLLTPGPTPIPEVVSAQFARPLIHHRTPAFEAVMAEVRADLKFLFQTEQEVMILASTGTGAMEAAIANLFSTGETVITINAGKFGERWGKIAKAYGLGNAEITLNPGESVTAAQIEAAIKAYPAAKAVLFQASETSTGASHPVKAIVDVCKKHGMLSVCDAITACGVSNLPMDAWGIDVMITGSQKALMIPPGLAFIAFGPKAWEKNKTANLPRFYFDLAREHKAHLKNQTAWTPAISLIQGLNVALKMIREEGLEKLYARHETLALAMRAGVKAAGLQLLSQASPSNSITAVMVPSAIASRGEGKKIPKTMRDKYGVTIAGGQDELEDKIFRLAHFGYVGAFDVTTALGALELTLNDLGYPVKAGTMVGAALQVIGERKLHG